MNKLFSKNYGRYIHNPLHLFFPLTRMGFFNWLPDELYIRLRFRLLLGYYPNLKKPKTYNEKLQWIKLNVHDSIYTTLVDKYAVKKWVTDKIGDQYVIPTLGRWSKFDDIDFDSLPNQFVLKCTHDSGSYVICKDKNKLDRIGARKRLTNALKKNFYYICREWPYKNVTPCIMAEQYMEDACGEIKDFKFFCFNGVPKFMYVSRDIAKSPTTDFFDMNYNHLNLRMKDPNASIPPPKPQNFELMKELAMILSKGLVHVRVDFYEVNGQVYFGEMTFFHNGGFSHIYPLSWEEKWGDLIELPR